MCTGIVTINKGPLNLWLGNSLLGFLRFDLMKESSKNHNLLCGFNLGNAENNKSSQQR